MNIMYFSIYKNRLNLLNNVTFPKSHTNIFPSDLNPFSIIILISDAKAGTNPRGRINIGKRAIIKHIITNNTLLDANDTNPLPPFNFLFNIIIFEESILYFSNE